MHPCVVLSPYTLCCTHAPLCCAVPIHPVLCCPHTPCVVLSIHPCVVLSPYTLCCAVYVHPVFVVLSIHPCVCCALHTPLCCAISIHPPLCCAVSIHPCVVLSPYTPVLCCLHTPLFYAVPIHHVLCCPHTPLCCAVPIHHVLCCPHTPLFYAVPIHHVLCCPHTPLCCAVPIHPCVMLSPYTPLAPSIAANSILELPLPLPNSDPERTAALLQLLDQLARTLTSSLLLPPKDHIHTPSIPVEKILGVVLHGLDQGPLAGHTTECRVVTAALPILHTCMWNILSSLIRTCHSHLFPYALRIRTSLVDEICSAEE